MVWDETCNKNSISGILPKGIKREIVFSSDPWKGKCEISFDSKKEKLDLYSEQENGTYSYVVEGKLSFSFDYILRCVTAFMVTLVTVNVISILYRWIVENTSTSRAVDKILHALIDNYLDKLLLVVISILAIIVRIKVLDNQTADYIYFLEPWYTDLKNNGGLLGLKNTISNYTEGYMLFLAFLTYLPLNPLYGIKLFSILFDFASAFLAYKMVLEFSGLKNKKFVGGILYSLILFIPTVILNSAYWGQCDSIYTFFITLSIYFYAKDRVGEVFVALGCALAFKLQTIMVIPVYLLLYCKDKKLSIKHFLLIPLAFFVWCLPSLAAGKPVVEILKCISSYGSGTTGGLTASFNNIYTFIMTDDANINSYISSIGKCFTFAMVAISMVIFSRGNWKITIKKVLSLFLFYIMMITYFLPGMHDRYLYLGDLLSVIWFVLIGKEKFWYIPIGINLFSLVNYIRFVTNVWPADNGHVLILVNALVALVYLIFMLWSLMILYKEVVNEE